MHRAATCTNRWSFPGPGREARLAFAAFRNPGFKVTQSPSRSSQPACVLHAPPRRGACALRRRRSGAPAVPSTEPRGARARRPPPPAPPPPSPPTARAASCARAACVEGAPQQQASAAPTRAGGAQRRRRRNGIAAGARAAKFVCDQQLSAGGHRRHELHVEAQLRRRGVRVRGLVPRVARRVPPDETAAVQIVGRGLVQPAPGPGERVARRKERRVGVDSCCGTRASHETVSVVLRQPLKALKAHLQAAVRYQEAGGQGTRGEHAEAAAHRRLELESSPLVRARRDAQHGWKQLEPARWPAAPRARGSRHEWTRASHSKQVLCTTNQPIAEKNAPRQRCACNEGSVRVLPPSARRNDAGGSGWEEGYCRGL
jgi:hypothetical protein